VSGRPLARLSDDGGTLGGQAGGDDRRVVARIAGVLYGGAQGAEQFLGILLDVIFAVAARRDRHLGVGDFRASGVEEYGAAGMAALVERQDEHVVRRHHRRRLAVNACTRSRTVIVST